MVGGKTWKKCGNKRSEGKGMMVRIVMNAVFGLP